jgi:hypothetical protein
MQRESATVILNRRNKYSPEARQAAALETAAGARHPAMSGLRIQPVHGRRCSCGACSHKETPPR